MATNSSLSRHDTASSTASVGRGKILLKKMYSQDEGGGGGETSMLNASHISGILTTPQTSFMDDRKRLAPARPSASAQAARKVLEKSKSSSALLAKGPPPPVPAKLDFHVELADSTDRRAKASSTLRKAKSMGEESDGNTSSFLNVSASPSIIRRYSAREVGTSTSATSSSSVSPVKPPSGHRPSPQQVRRISSLTGMSGRTIRRHSSSASNSSAGGSKPSPVKVHAAKMLTTPPTSASSVSSRPNASPSKRVLLSAVLEKDEPDSTMVNPDERFKILHRAGGRSRGTPVDGESFMNQQQLASPVNPTFPSGPVSPPVKRSSMNRFGSAASQHSPLDLINITASHIASPVETNKSTMMFPSPVEMLNNSMASGITSPVANTSFVSKPTSEQKRRSQRNNESHLDVNGNTFFVKSGKREQALPEDFQRAFDEPSMNQVEHSKRLSVRTKHALPSKNITETSFDEALNQTTHEVEEPQRDASAVNISRRLSRYSKSAPNTVDQVNDLPPLPALAPRFKTGKSPLKESLTGRTSLGGGEPPLKSNIPAIAKPSPMRDLFRKSLGGPIPETAVHPFTGAMTAKRKVKEDRLSQFLDSPRELRGLAMEDGGLLTAEIRKTAWPSLLADASRRIPIVQANLNDSDSSLNDSSNALVPSPQRKKDHHQIDLDVLRKYEENDLKSRDRLRRFLHGFFDNHPELCYFQGFHDLCALVLKVFDDDLVADFVVFKISSNTIVRDAHRQTMDAVFSQLKTVFAIIESADPELADKLRSTIGTESFWGISMLTCLFAHDVADEASIERLLDACIAGSPHFPLYLVAGLALLPKTRLFIMNSEYDETAVLGAIREDARAIEMAEADELVRFAQILQRRVPPSKIMEQCYRKLELPVDSFLASRWLVKTSKWVFGSGFKVRDKPLGE